MESDTRWIALRYPGRCRRWSRELVKGDRALHDRVAGAEACAQCGSQVGAPSPEGPLDVGTAGACAQREYERRRHARVQRARARWHSVGLGGVGAGLARLNVPQSERAFKKGGRGEERVAERLEQLVAADAIVLLHDRRIPGSRANIDHIAVGAGGVTVIDAKYYDAKVRTGSRGGLLRPRSKHRRNGGRDRTRLVEGIKRQAISSPRRCRQQASRSTSVCALCMVDVGALRTFGHLHVDGIAVDGSRHIAKVAKRPGSPTRDEVHRIATTIAQAFPPA